MLRHPALAGAGKYSFHVYLLHRIVMLIGIAAGVDVAASASIVAVLLITFLLGGLCAPPSQDGLLPFPSPPPNSRSRLTHTLADCEYVEGPLVKLCRAGFKACWSRVYQPISTVVVE